MNQIAYFVFQRKHVFVKLDFLYPECKILIEDKPQLSPLQCMRTSCPVNAGCVETLAKRVLYFFEALEPQAQLLIAYFKYRNEPNSIKAGIFHKDMREPRIVTVNQSGFRKFQSESITKVWTPSEEFINIRGVQALPQIIPANGLIRTK